MGVSLKETTYEWLFHGRFIHFELSYLRYRSCNTSTLFSSLVSTP